MDLGASSFWRSSVLGGPSLDLNLVSGTLDSRVTFTRASTASYYNSSGVLTSASTNIPRFDYDPVTLAPKGLLLEEARTNLCLRSAELDNAAWSTNSATRTADQLVSPDGGTNADLLTLTGGSAPSVYQAITVTASTAYTFSWFVRLGTLAAADFKFAIYNATAAGFIASDIAPSTTPTASGWVRQTYTFTTPVGCVSVRVYPFRNSGTVAGTLYLWGMQLEAGSFATSHIPTVASTVARAGDSAVVGTITPWHSPSSGTLFAEFQRLGTVASSFPRVLSLSDGTNSNLIELVYSSPNDQFAITTATVAQGPIVVANGGTALNKLAAAYALNDTAASINGSAAAVDGSVTVPSVDRLHIGNRQDGARPFSGHIRSIKYWPTRKSNTELQALTA